MMLPINSHNQDNSKPNSVKKKNITINDWCGDRLKMVYSSSTNLKATIATIINDITLAVQRTPDIRFCDSFIAVLIFPLIYFNVRLLIYKILLDLFC